MCRRSWLAALVASAAAAFVVVGPAHATTEGAPPDLADALVMLDDMPVGWGEYVAPTPSPRVRTRKAICGGSPRAPLATEDEAWTAYALDNVEGPVFGERIASYGPREAERLIVRITDDLPCTWTDSGIRWRASPLPRLHLGDDDTGYVRHQLHGNFAFSYNYEYRVRRGDVLLAFVFNSQTPDRKLAEKLVRRAVDRYDESPSVAAETIAATRH